MLMWLCTPASPTKEKPFLIALTARNLHFLNWVAPTTRQSKKPITAIHSHSQINHLRPLAVLLFHFLVYSLSLAALIVSVDCTIGLSAHAGARNSRIFF